MREFILWLIRSGLICIGRSDDLRSVEDPRVLAVIGELFNLRLIWIFL